MANIELTQVAKRFGESYAVQPLDLQIKDGEFIALLGPSGCGKTTTLRMIAGLETVSEGKITLNGADVTQLPPSQRDIAMVFQFFALYPHLSVRENIAFPLKAQGGRGARVDEPPVFQNCNATDFKLNVPIAFRQRRQKQAMSRSVLVSTRCRWSSQPTMCAPCRS